MTWTIEPNGIRHLLGATAFFTHHSAGVSKLSRLMKLRRMPSWRWEIRAYAEKIIKEYHATGIMP